MALYEEAGRTLNAQGMQELRAVLDEYGEDLEALAAAMEGMIRCMIYIGEHLGDQENSEKIAKLLREYAERFEPFWQRVAEALRNEGQDVQEGFAALLGDQDPAKKTATDVRGESAGRFASPRRHRRRPRVLPPGRRRTSPEPVSLPGVSKTAVLTLRARAQEHERPDAVFEDPVAADWIAKLDWPAELDDWYADKAQTNIALRAADLDHLVRRLAAEEPVATVVELGCGFSTRSSRLHDLDVRWVGIDLPEVVALRRAWGAGGNDVARSVVDRAWMQAIGRGPHVFVAEGLFYYLPRAEVDALLNDMHHAFPGAVLLMDVLGAFDFPTLRAHTERVGAPIQWHLERAFTEVLEDFGLAPIDGFAPDEVAQRALRRYFTRLDPAAQVMTWWALNAGVLPPQRSGNVVGRLGGQR